MFFRTLIIIFWSLPLKTQKNHRKFPVDNNAGVDNTVEKCGDNNTLDTSRTRSGPTGPVPGPRTIPPIGKLGVPKTPSF